MHSDRELMHLVGGSELRATKARCRLCQELILERTIYHPALHDPHGVIGPGYRPLRGSWEERQYHCGGCGIKYEFVREDEDAKDT